ncbi:DUF5009 domain-containing protein [Croceivirga radicis]|uniref:DUF5009 domain-containing protein n=1 Tax=Croceivirga radicis TaxID=1929488 RepID=A0A1V6LSV0_9FLAO|nr:DUF5009 domain-containing protein [Croceivirga radicis]OQD43137.1 DUF5009 domain-containing protein [Croceivirga radicis]
MSTSINKTNRFLALDVFRGLTICLMILVNSPGTGADIYPYLSHANWFGFTLADLVFPSFLFAMGNAMSFSMAKLKTTPASKFYKKVVRRTLIIFLLGYLMYWFPFFEWSAQDFSLKPVAETRIMGVLQRIALCYFFASVLIYHLNSKLVALISALILLLYWCLLYWFDGNGGVLEMGSNAITRLDLFLLGEGHVYKKDSVPFDPEGLLSTLPSIVNVLGGYFAGVYLKKNGNTFKSIAVLMVAGFLIYTLGQWWNLIFPISKKLWTSSFALHTIGLDLFIMATLVYAIEIKKVRFGVYFFDVFGKNPLFIYLFSELFFITLRLIPVTKNHDAFEWFSEAIVQQIFPGAFGALITGVLFMLLCWFVGLWLHKKKIYIKI